MPHHPYSHPPLLCTLVHDFRGPVDLTGRGHEVSSQGRGGFDVEHTNAKEQTVGEKVEQLAAGEVSMGMRGVCEDG